MFEGQFDGLDFRLRTMGKIGDGAMLNLAVEAKALAKEVTGVFPAFARVDVHGDYTIITIHNFNSKQLNSNALHVFPPETSAKNQETETTSPKKKYRMQIITQKELIMRLDFSVFFKISWIK